MIPNQNLAVDGTDRPVQAANRFDYILVGGGLQSGLIALALRHRQPHASIAIIESSSRLAGNHTWSFHATDVTPDSAPWIDLIVEHHWPCYDVLVGGRVRRVNIGYYTISSQFFAQRIEALFSEPNGHGPGSILRSSTALQVGAQHVLLDDGQVLNAACVIDNRGPQATTSGDIVQENFCGGFQKFWGFELKLPIDWPLKRPVIMDDRVDQQDGFRFIYTLPFEARRVLVEDTRFSNTPEIKRVDCFHQVDRYLRQITQGKIGIEHCEIVREEHGVLPMPTAGFYPGHTAAKNYTDARNQRNAIDGGYRGGWFHAATGYSFPMALRFATWIASTPVEQLPAKLAFEARKQAVRATFARFLNRLLFELVRPPSRYQIFRRFYRVLTERRIARFYAHQFTVLDATRIVIGMPPGGLQPIRFFQSFFRRSRPSKLASRPQDAVLEIQSDRLMHRQSQSTQEVQS